MTQLESLVAAKLRGSPVSFVKYRNLVIIPIGGRSNLGEKGVLMGPEIDTLWIFGGNVRPPRGWTIECGGGYLSE